MDGGFCVECGLEGPTVDALCPDCLRARVTVVQVPAAGAHVEICRHCGATPVSGVWGAHGSEAELVERAALDACHVLAGLDGLVVRARVEQVDRDKYHATLHVAGHYKGVPLEATIGCPVKVRGASCPACSRRHGGYYEAMVQVRGPGGEPLEERVVERVDELVDATVRAQGGAESGQAYLLRREPMHGGVDYYFGTLNVARAVARAAAGALGARITESKTIAGKRDGTDIFRTTMAVRLPSAVPGDIVALDEDVYRVLNAAAHRLIAEHVATGRRETMDDRTVARLYRFKPAEIRKLEIVFARDDEFMVLDPDTQKTETLRAPRMEPGEAIHAVKWRDRWWPLPPRH